VGLLPKILSGEKTVETRWFVNKRRPWGMVKAGDVVYFKDSSKPITAKAKVSTTELFSDLDSKKVRSLLEKYASQDGIPSREIDSYASLFSKKRYCMIVGLSNPSSIKPFNINKVGFGSMSAWICVPNINSIKVELPK
jgi:ASC-1-like (ASCH) protein